MKLIIFFSSVLMVVCVCAGAQDVKTDIKKINTVYKRDRYRLNLTYKVFKSYNDTAPIQSENALVMKNGNQLYYKIGAVESIQCEEYAVVADHSDKVIALLPRKYKTNRPDMLAADLDSLLSTCEEIGFKVIDKRKNIYILTLSKFSDYERVAVQFDPLTHEIQQMDFFYRDKVNLTDDAEVTQEKPRMELHYMSFDKSPTFESTQFNYGLFLVKSGKNYALKDTYKGYEFINQM